VVVDQKLMIHKPGKAAVTKHLVELRREAVAALKRFNSLAERLNFYEQYLALGKKHDVQMAGPFLVIKGGQSQTEHSRTENQSPTLREIK
jgi:hypothetical protein